MKDGGVDIDLTRLPKDEREAWARFFIARTEYEKAVEEFRRAEQSFGQAQRKLGEVEGRLEEARVVAEKFLAKAKDASP